MSTDTYLSSGVRDLLLTVESIGENIDENRLSIDRIRQCIVLEETGIDYRRSVQRLNREVFPSLEKFFDQMTVEQFRMSYDHDQYCAWLTDKEDLFRIFDLMKKQEIVLATLLLTSFTERNLGNLLLLHVNTVPNLLRQIVESSSLQTILGANMTLILQCVIGSPKSINLRNVYWHGFVQFNEVPVKFSYLLLYLLLQIGPTIDGNAVKKRPFLSLDRFIKKTSMKISRGVDLENIVCCPSAELAVKLIDTSIFVDEGYKPLLISSVRYFYDLKEYGLSMILLLPIYEHMLRKLFVRFNHCPERLLTAEATTLYTTLDEILVCCLPNGTVNRLCHELGDGYMGLLGDLITFPEGVCLRSKLSHSEIDYRTLPRSVGESQWILFFTLLYRYDERTIDDFGQSVLDYVQNYQICYHPIAIARNQILQWIDEFQQLPPPTSENLSEENPLNLSKFWRHFITPDRLILYENISLSSLNNLLNLEHVHLINRSCSCKAMSSDYNEQTLITLIRQSMSHLHQININIDDFFKTRGQAYQAKQLRENQRLNFDRFLDLYPRLYRSLLSLAQFNGCLLSSLDRIRVIEGKFVLFLKKFARIWLTYVENVVTLSNRTRNRWDEIVTLDANSLEKSSKLFEKLCLF